MTINQQELDQYKDKLIPQGWMKAVVIGASERKSQKGLDMFDIQLEIIEEYNEDPEEYENTLGYKIQGIAVYPDKDLQGDKARATGQAFKAFQEAFNLGDGDITAQDLLNAEVMIRVVYETGQDGKNRPKIAFGGYRSVEA